MPITVEQAKTELRRRRATEELARRKQPEPTVGPPDYGMVAIPKERLPGVWDYDKQLDDLFSGETELEDLMPLDVRYDFGRIIGMTEKPDDTRAKMVNSLYYSVQLGVPPEIAFNMTDELSKIWFGEKKLPLQPGRLFAQSFIQSMAEKPAMMFKGLEVYTPGTGKVDTLLEKSSTFLQSLKDPETAEKLQKARAGKLWPIAKYAKWYQVQAKYLPEVINAWATNVGDQIPIMLTTMAGRVMGKAVGEPIGAATAVAWATATGGLDPTDVATAPMVKTITSKVIEHLGGAAPLVAMETGFFMDEAETLKIDKDIAEKYAKIYGPGSGAIEYAQWLWVLGRYKAITKTAQNTIMRQVITHIGGSAVEGLEEISQEGLQNWLLQKAVAEMKERHPEYTGVAPKTWEGWKRSGAIGAGVSFITAMPGTGLTMAQGRAARREIVKPETKMPEVVEVPVAKKPPAEVIAEPEKIIHTIREMTPEEIAEDEAFWKDFPEIKKGLERVAERVPSLVALQDTLKKRIDLLKKVELGILTQEEADALTEKFAEAAKLRIEAPTVLIPAPQPPRKAITPEKAVEVPPEAKKVKAEGWKELLAEVDTTDPDVQAIMKDVDVAFREKDVDKLLRLLTQARELSEKTGKNEALYTAINVLRTHIRQELAKPEAVEVARKPKNLGLTKKDITNMIAEKGFTHIVSNKLEATGYFTKGELSYLGGTIDQDLNDPSFSYQEKLRAIEVSLRQFIQDDIEIFAPTKQPKKALAKAEPAKVEKPKEEIILKRDNLPDKAAYKGLNEQIAIAKYAEVRRKYKPDADFAKEFRAMSKAEQKRQIKDYRPGKALDAETWLKRFAKLEPEFAANPVFTVKEGMLVFKDDFKYSLEPRWLGLDKAELKEGQQIRVDLVDLSKPKKAKPKEPTKPGVSLLGGVPVEPAGLTRAEVEHLGKREQKALRAAQRRGLKVGYKQGAAETIADARRSLDAFRMKEAISQKGKMDVASVVLTYVPKEKQGDYIRRILQAKTQKRIERLTEAIDKYLDKYEKRQAIKGFKTFVKGIKKKYRRGEVALGQLPSKLRESLIEVLDKFDLAKISEKKEETLESRLKFVTRISGELANGFEGLNAEFDKDATDVLLMGTRRIEELKRLSQKYIGDLDVDEIKYIQASLEHLLKINDLKGKSKERRRMENLRTDINNARQEVLPEKAIVKRYTGVLGAVRWLGVEGQSTLRTLVGLATSKENDSTHKLLVEELDKANIQRKEAYKGFIMYFRGLLTKKGLDWPDVRNLQNLTKITIGGKEVEIDYDNLLALYAYTQAEGTLRRLLKTKGLNITVYARDKNGIFTKKSIYRVGRPTLDELRTIAEKVPENHKRLLDVYFKTNRDKQAPAINETSMAYQNYDLAVQEKYWHVNREIERVVEGKKADVSISINEQGRYLPRQGGSARINIRPFTMEVMNSMQSDAAYHAMTIPMENARTLVANTKWREAMKKAGQQRALDEITRMLRRTQGLISDQSIIELTASRLLGTVGKSILSLRISGGLVQTASVPAAVEFIKKEYLVQIDVPTRKDIQHLKDISPVLWMRWEAKQFDYALGLVGAETAFETLLFEHRALTDKLLVPYTIGDEVAIAKLFMAAQRQIEAETKLKRGTAEFQDASLELLYKAMNTQPQWDMIHRSPLTSDPSILARSISMFMSARNAQYNVLVRAMDDYRKGRTTKGQLSERLAGVGMANLFVSVARHSFKTAITAGAITVFTALGLRKPPDEEEIKKEAVRLAKKIPLETVFNMVGLNAMGTLFVSMGYAALKTRKYGWGMGRYSDIRTGNMMADLTLDFMQLGIDFTMFTDQIISGEKYKTGKNRGRYKWEITGLRLIDDMALLIAYRFGLPYEGPKSDIIWPTQKALKGS